MTNLLVILFLNKPELMCLRTAKGFQLLLLNISNSIYQAFLPDLILIICLQTVT